MEAAAPTVSRNVTEDGFSNGNEDVLAIGTETPIGQNGRSNGIAKSSFSSASALVSYNATKAFLNDLSRYMSSSYMNNGGSGERKLSKTEKLTRQMQELANALSRAHVKISELNEERLMVEQLRGQQREEVGILLNSEVARADHLDRIRTELLQDNEALKQKVRDKDSLLLNMSAELQEQRQKVRLQQQLLNAQQKQQKSSSSSSSLTTNVTSTAANASFIYTEAISEIGAQSKATPTGEVMGSDDAQTVEEDTNQQSAAQLEENDMLRRELNTHRTLLARMKVEKEAVEAALGEKARALDDLTHKQKQAGGSDHYQDLSPPPHNNGTGSTAAVSASTLSAQNRVKNLSPYSSYTTTHKSVTHCDGNRSCNSPTSVYWYRLLRGAAVVTNPRPSDSNHHTPTSLSKSSSSSSIGASASKSQGPTSESSNTHDGVGGVTATLGEAGRKASGHTSVGGKSEWTKSRSCSESRKSSPNCSLASPPADQNNSTAEPLPIIKVHSGDDDHLNENTVPPKTSRLCSIFNCCALAPALAFSKTVPCQLSVSSDDGDES